MFEGKDILDIGCNVGHVTLSVARDFGAKSVTGIDIDPKLIAIARKNVKYYVKNSESPKPDQVNGIEVPKKKSSEFFPISMPILYGSIDIPGFSDANTGRDFPNNVVFKTVSFLLSLCVGASSKIVSVQLRPRRRFASSSRAATVRRNSVFEYH